jgi:hypothetical protein
LSIVTAELEMLEAARCEKPDSKVNASQLWWWLGYANLAVGTRTGAIPRRGLVEGELARED